MSGRGLASLAVGCARVAAGDGSVASGQRVAAARHRCGARAGVVADDQGAASDGRSKLGQVDRVGACGACGDIGDLALGGCSADRYAVVAIAHRTLAERDAAGVGGSRVLA